MITTFKEKTMTLEFTQAPSGKQVIPTFNLEIKAYKTFYSREGGGYHFNLYDGKKKIAFVHDDGNGGSVDVDTFGDKQMLMDLMAYVDSLPPYKFMDQYHNHCFDTYFSELISQHQFNKALKKHKAIGTCYRIKSDDEYSFHAINTKDMNVVTKMLDEKFGANNYTII
jgi:hypothetical protein